MPSKDPNFFWLPNLASRGRAHIQEDYNVAKVVHYRSLSRLMAFASKAKDLAYQYSNQELFNLKIEDREHPDARRRVLEEWNVRKQAARYPLPSVNVDIVITYHTPPSEEIAQSILKGGFAVLASHDAGFYGQGIYLSLDAEYSIEQYGLHPRQRNLSGDVPLLVCATICGNPFPIVEMPQSQGTRGFLGRPIEPKADAHVAIVALGIDAREPLKEPWWYPCRPELYSDPTRTTYTEIVVREASQVLPLGYMMVTPTGQQRDKIKASLDKEMQFFAEWKKKLQQFTVNIEDVPMDEPPAKESRTYSASL